MNKLILMLFLVFMVVGWLIYIQYQLNGLKTNVRPQIRYTIKNNVPQKKKEVSNWENLINAIIEVESEGKINVVNKQSGATGVLQITDIYIIDCNRILGKKKYKLTDRYNKRKSVEIFNIYQNHYNPEHNISKAIVLHNPNGGKEYYLKVINKLEKNKHNNNGKERK